MHKVHKPRKALPKSHSCSRKGHRLQSAQVTFQGRCNFTKAKKQRLGLKIAAWALGLGSNLKGEKERKKQSLRKEGWQKNACEVYRNYPSEPGKRTWKSKDNYRNACRDAA